MRPISAFTPPWDSDGSGSTIYDPSGARHKGTKRSRSVSEDLEHLQSPDELTHRSTQSYADRQDQYHVAGHDTADPFPSSSFPHSSGAGRRGSKARASAAVEDEIAAPLGHPPPSREQISQLKQHVTILNTILHTSLLRGDYTRAGRAFAMLLRLPRGAAKFPLRANGHWSIGAQILLRRPSVNSVSSPTRTGGVSRSSNEDSDNDSNPSSLEVNPDQDPSEENFALAKSYYESLILQYPYDKAQSDKVDARIFYPSYFTICIHEATTTSKRGLARLSADDRDSDDMVDDDHQAARLEIKQIELDAARAIARRMDETLVSPPYDRLVHLIRMRADVGYWIADLVEAMQEYSNSDNDINELEISDAERSKAEALMERAKKLSGGLERGQVKLVRAQ